jgi:hypothetical protein
MSMRRQPGQQEPVYQVARTGGRSKTAQACPKSRMTLNGEMTRTRQLIIAFWVFIAIMLGWQFYSYNVGMQTRAEQPQQDHFFFYQTNAAHPVAPKMVYHGPALQQIAFRIEPNTPPGNFTCDVTIKNVGIAKATNIQINVRPFRGILNGDPDFSRQNDVKPIDDNSSLAQISQWIAFSDLGPGESETQSATFINVSGVSPGTNPDPQIEFEPEKAPQAAPPLNLPPHRSPGTE